MRSLFYLSICIFASMTMAALHYDHVQDSKHGTGPNVHLGDDHHHHPVSLPKPTKRFGGFASGTSPGRKKSSLALPKRAPGSRTLPNASRPRRKQSQTTPRTKKSSSRPGSRAGSRTSSHIGLDTGHLAENHYPSSSVSHSPSSVDFHAESKGSSVFHDLMDPLLSSHSGHGDGKPRPTHRGRKPVHPKSFSKDRGITALTDASAFY